jgi:hypothetical protein
VFVGASLIVTAPLAILDGLRGGGERMHRAS